MTQYIDKAAVVVEINRVLNSYDPNEITSGRYALVSLRNFIDTLEVKEVDLETEIDRWLGREAFPEGVGVTPLPKAMEIVERTAKHFFELGLKAQKGE